MRGGCFVGLLVLLVARAAAPLATGPPEPGATDTSSKEEHRYPVVSADFSRTETPFMIALWIFCSTLAKIGFHMAPRLHLIFPESCLLILVGVVLGFVLQLLTPVKVADLTPDAFFFYMLPPIILDAGYFMPNRLFFDNLGTILLFAVVNTIFNTLSIGLCLWGVGQTGLFGCETPLLDMLLFSALISAVDPVAVLAVFEEIHVNEVLYIVVFGESLLNDAVTVVLYHMFESYSKMSKEADIIYRDVVAGFMSFFVVAIGGTVIGVLWGFLTGLVTRFTDQVRVIEPLFVFVMAYLAYLNAEIFHMSGILAITFCGITMKNYVEANISHKSHTTVKYAMKMLSSSSETIIFMFLGVATFSNQHDWNTWFVLLTITFCSIFRVIGVVVLTSIVNNFRIYKIDKVDRFVIAYGGIRGAVAFALVQTIRQEDIGLQPMFLTTTIAVVYFTVFFQGITIKPLVKILNVKKAEKRKPTMNERIHEKIIDHAMSGIEDILGQHGNYHVRDRFKRFDNRFIRPYLIRDHQGAEPKILETYSKLAMKDAMDYMRRNASTIGNISGTESMSAIFRNYTMGNFNGSFSQLDNSTWNIDMQELEYNPSKKDLTDARIHHLLAEELCQPHRRHRRLSYSRHAVNDKDLSTQVNYRMHMNIRRLVGDQRKHHKRSKRLNKEGKQVSFPGIQQNGSAKQFSHDYIDKVIQEAEDEAVAQKSGKSDWDAGITFTAHPPSEASPKRSSSAMSLLSQIASLPGFDPEKTRLVQEFRSSRPSSLLYQDSPTIAEASLPWRRHDEEDSCSTPPMKKHSKDSNASDAARVTTPTALEKMLPWKRDDEGEMSTGPLKQSEFPPWCSNKEYLAYNSPSSTFLGGLEQSRRSVIGLFRRESAESPPLSESPSPPPSSVLLIEEGTSLLSHQPSSSTQIRKPPPRRGSMLEIGMPVTPIQEEAELVAGSGEGSTPSLTEHWLCSETWPLRRQKNSHQLLKKSLESFDSSDSEDYTGT